MSKLFLLLILVFSFSFGMAQYNYVFSENGCTFDISINLKKKKHARSVIIDANLTIFNTDSISKYFPFSNPVKMDAPSEFLFSLNEYFLKSNVVEFAVGTCNEFRFPLYYCKTDSVLLTEVLPGNNIKVKVLTTSNLLNKKMMNTGQINFIIRFVNGDVFLSKFRNGRKVGIDAYVRNSSLISLEFNRQNAKDPK